MLERGKNMQTKLRKIVSVLVCAVMILSCITLSKATNVSAAAGTAEDPVLIKTVDDLKKAVKSTSKTYYKLANDIVINDVTVKIENGVGVIYNADGTEKLTEEELSKLTPWINEGYADTASRFRGTLDGDGHVIRGLYLNTVAPYEKAGDDYKYARALISYAGDGAAIKNLGLEDAYVSYEYGTASGFIGNMQNAKISAENCYVGKSAYFYGYNASAFFGSGNQSSKASYVKNGYSLATLKLQSGVSDTRFGAIYADVWNSKTTAENFYTTTKLTHAGVTSLANVYDNVKSANGTIGTAFEGNTFFPGDVFCAVEGELPTLKYFKGVAQNVWSGLGDSDIAGSGTSADPYLITSGEELAYVMSKNGDINPDASNEWFKLANDIYLNNVFAENWKENTNNYEWYSAANNEDFKTKLFKGNIDGQGYCVYGIWYPLDSTAYASGLVPGIGSYTVKNVGIKQAQIVASYYAGGIVGYCSDGAATTISSCFSDSSVDLLHNNANINGGAGGIVGYHMGGNSSNILLIENCWSAANCSSASHGDRANGIIGTIWNGYHKVKNCYTLGNAPYVADVTNRVSLLAYDGTLVKYTNANDNEISGKPTDNSNYKIVYKDYTDTYTCNASTGKYTSKRTYTSYSKLSEAYVNNYGSVSKAVATSPEGYKSYTNLNASAMTGENALGNMGNLDGDVWYAVKDNDISPLHRLYGTAIGDVNEDGVGLAAGDDTALRIGLIGAATAKNGDYNRSGETDILDLVAIIIDLNNVDAATCPHYFKSEVVTESTATVDGIIEHTCPRCDYSYEENIGTSIKLLAIGSSHTMNSITYFGDICEAAGIDNVYLGHMYKGGVTFQQQYEAATGIDTNGDGVTSHAFSYRTYENSKWSAYTGGMKVSDVVPLADWDYIVINQGAIDAPLYGQELANGDVRDTFDPYFYWQVDYIKSLAPDATLCWNMTFACEEYETGDPRYDKCDLRGQYKNWFNFNSHTMYDAIVGAVQKYVLPEEEIEIILPAATVVQNLRSSYRGQTLTNDLTHLDDDPENLHGRYAVGLTWFKAITGADLSDFDWVPADNLTDDLPMIYEAVNNAIAYPLAETESTYKVAP